METKAPYTSGNNKFRNADINFDDKLRFITIPKITLDYI